MSDEGFDFKPPPATRAKKPFEPPPWEQDRFDEVRRQREDAERAARALTESQARGKEVEPGNVGKPAPEEPAVNIDTPVETSPHGPVEGVLDEKQLELMFRNLRNEEPAAVAGLWKIQLSSALIMASVGVLLTVWGTYALVSTGRTGAAGALGGMVLLFFGFGFIGAGVWLALRTLRQRGVL